MKKKHNGCICAVTALLISLFLTWFPIAVQASPAYQTGTGTLSVTVYNVGGATRSGASVKLYDTNWVLKYTVASNSSGVATFNNIPAATYNMEVYYQPTGVSPAANELWGSKSVTVVANQSTPIRFDRSWPITDIRQSQPVVVPSNVITGVSNNIQVKVYAPQGGSYTTRVKMIIDRSEAEIRNELSKINEKLDTSKLLEALESAIDLGLVGWQIGDERNLG